MIQLLAAGSIHTRSLSPAVWYDAGQRIWCRQPLQTLLTSEILLALGITAGFAGGAWLLRGVTGRGALAGFVVAFTIYVSAGPGGFAALIAVFVVALLTTRFGYCRKIAQGTAESPRGRSALQVLANLGAAAGFALAAHAATYRFLLLAAIAALAEAAADTAASECGEALSDRAYLVTNFQRVAAGTDGGISFPGTAAAISAALAVAAVATVTGVISWAALPLVAVSGVIGTFVDSVLGATLERRGILGNDGVNFASTLAAAMLALLIGR